MEFPQMWTDGNGSMTQGDCPSDWRAATQAEVEAYFYARRKNDVAFNIRQAFNDAISTYTGYPATETLSWYRQYDEAVAYQESNGLNIGPFLQAYDNNRGVGKDLPTFVQDILANADGFAAAAGTLKGKKTAKEAEWHALLSAYEAGTATYDDIAAFNPIYSL